MKRWSTFAAGMTVGALLVLSLPMVMAHGEDLIAAVLGRQLEQNREAITAFRSAVDAFSQEVQTLKQEVTTLKGTTPPVGSIIGWHKSFNNTPQSLPTGWAECNGQTLSDQESVYNGQVMPNLNNQVYANQRGWYLRGGKESGHTNGSTYWTDNGYQYKGGNDTDIDYYGATFARFGDLDSSPAEKPVYHESRLSSSRRFQVAAMTVVWIIRVK